MRTTAHFPSPAAYGDVIKDKALDWAHARYGAYLFLDSCGYPDPHGAWDWLLLAGGEDAGIEDELAVLIVPEGGWFYGHIPYEACYGPGGAADLRNPDYGWAYVPFRFADVVVGQRRGAAEIVVFGDNPGAVWADVLAQTVGPLLPLPKVRFSPVLDKHAYVAAVDAVRARIAAGDCYELNLCNRRNADRPVRLDAVSAFRQLRAQSPAPFSALLRHEGTYTICASPERYLCGRNGRVISQPIKGTASRGGTAETDEAARAGLAASGKDRAENVMIVDLVRSDLARTCKPGTVLVDELFGIQTFPAVHQMVSTVSGELYAGADWWDAVRHSFPMGSMTGAPKEMVMRLIERYEPGPRGRFSGALGYVESTDCFDLNVVIRSLFYEEGSGALWYSTGGAITWASDPEAEWEETVLKGAAIERLFE